MAELFGRVDGCSHGRGGSMHMFDLARRFMGGYGIVGGNLPIAAGHRAGQRLQGHRRGHAVHVRRRRLQPGHVRRDAEPGGAVEAAGRVHGDQQPVRHGHRAQAPLGRHRPAAQGREPGRARDALRRHGRAATRTRSSPRRCGACARTAGRCWSRRSPTASAATRWPTPRSTARRRRSRTGASATRSPRSRELLIAEGVIDEAERRADRRDRRSRASTRRSSSPTASPFPAPESLYDDVYVLERAGARLVLGRARRRRATVAAGRRPARRRRRATAANDEIPQQLTDALAAGEDGPRARPRTVP